METNLILLTGTIQPAGGVNVVLTNPTIRYQQYASSIGYFLNETEFDDVVFVENSDYEFDAEQFHWIAKSLKKRFEYIHRHISPEFQKEIGLKGKSLGEADLIDFAIKNSRLIPGHKSIYKITGRCQLLNASQLLHHQMADNEFIVSFRRKWLTTYFFRVNVDDYIKILSPIATLMDDSIEHNIERLWYKKVKEEISNRNCFCFMPRIHGVYGNSDGKTYDKSKFEYIVGDFVCKTKLGKI